MQGSALPEGGGGEVSPHISSLSSTLLYPLHFPIFTGESAGRARGKAPCAFAGAGVRPPAAVGSGYDTLRSCGAKLAPTCLPFSSLSSFRGYLHSR